MGAPPMKALQDQRAKSLRHSGAGRTRGRMFASLAVLSAALAISSSGAALAQGRGSNALQSAGALAFAPGGVLFVGDIRAAEIHAYQLPATDFTDQSDVEMGNARTFNGRDLISGIDQKLAALLGTTADQIAIN